MPDPARATKDILLSLIPPFPVSTYLIDDGWQDIVFDDRGLKRLHSFHPWSNFGGDITEVITTIKSRGAKYVGVWMTLEGYWHGIDPQSDLARNYECSPFKVSDHAVDGGFPTSDAEGRNQYWIPSPRKAGAFWRDWFAAMKSCGIDFVKVGIHP